uniref:DNA topoisomerase 2 n=1 Tax=Theileria annulata TaxID=5874 RepID=A0A3B0MZG4_THEAN
MISKSSFFIWNNEKCRILYTLIILCNIIKVSSGYLLNGNGIIRNTQINIPNLVNLSTSGDNFKTNNNKINKFYLKDQNIEDAIPSPVTDGDEKGENVNQLQDTGEYSSDDIIVLEGLNAVRKRPGMYIGNTGERGVHQLLYEVLDNSVDEYLAGFCNRITVSLMKDGSVEVSDNGRGIPCDISPKTGKSGLETVLTVLHSGGKFQDIFPPNSTSMGSEDQKDLKSRKKGEKEHEEKKVYEYSSGLHGVGLSVVNALSELLIVDVYKGPKSYHIELSKGNIVKPLTEFSEPETTDKPNNNLKRYGTTIRFLPDYKNIFKTHHQHTETEKEEDYDTTTNKSGLDTKCSGCKNGFILELIKTRAKELSYLNPGLSIKLVDYRITDENNEPWEETYRNTGGTRSFLEELIKDKTPLYKPISYITIKGVISNINVEVSFSWSLESYTALIKGYANNVSTIAGTHIDGFKISITRCVNGLLKKYGYFKGNVKPLNGEFIREGMTAVISVKLTGAEFDGQTKTKLGNALVKTVTEKIVNEQFTNILENNKELLLAIHNKSQAAKKAFDAARTAKDLIRQKSSSIVSNISGKLTECSSSKVENNELFIVEGESAAGNAKQARNRQFQAVLPLKGKILNIEKITDNSKVLENQQIQLLMNSIGISINPVTWRQNDLTEGTHMAMDPLIEMNSSKLTRKQIWLDLSKLRYGKIILLTDADVDGSHLKSLLLCLLYRLCPSLYLHGRVYVASPPLYRITNLRNKKYIYSWSQEHLLKTIKELNSKYSAKETTERVRQKDNADDLGNEYEDEFNDDEDDREGNVEEIELKTELGSNITKDEKSDELDLYNINKSLSKNNKHLIIQRFKGLGEMMANQLWETTMDPKKRILKRIVVSQEPEISEIIRLLMGSDVQSRKQYIFNNSGAFNLEDLDI